MMSRKTTDDTSPPRPRTLAFRRNRSPAEALSLTPVARVFLLELQRQALLYFLENQADNGLVLDRQHNHGPRRPEGLCSLTATGMGLIALALASAPPYRLLSPGDAAGRIAAALRTALTELPHDHGVLPHFVHSVTNRVVGVDHFSTIETAWMAAGGMWAAAFLGDGAVHVLADRLYDRIDFRYWTAPDLPDASGLLRHGMDWKGNFLRCCWDRLNGETVFMYLLAAGAGGGKELTASFWPRLRSFHGEVAGLSFNNADLGLFVFQYGLDLLDAREWQVPGGVDLAGEARLATLANELACRAAADVYRTYRRCWGLSAGDGPHTDGRDAYRCYAPGGPIDGTAQLTVTLASLAHHPGAVLENLYQADYDPALKARGRYGFSNVNQDRNWVGRDMVGIDAGAAVLALDNVLAGNRVRCVFHDLPCVRQGLERLGFRRRTATPSPAGEDDWSRRRAG